jgi:hypothetical protein
MGTGGAAGEVCFLAVLRTSRGSFVELTQVVIVMTYKIEKTLR